MLKNPTDEIKNEIDECLTKLTQQNEQESI